jgi:hypothetical protein
MHTREKLEYIEKSYTNGMRASRPRPYSLAIIEICRALTYITIYVSLLSPHLSACVHTPDDKQERTHDARESATATMFSSCDWAVRHERAKDAVRISVYISPDDNTLEEPSPRLSERDIDTSWEDFGDRCVI